ncbi:hypothetical protein JOQ06_028609, partial [Pogonophryne albipinna]
EFTYRSRTKHNLLYISFISLCRPLSCPAVYRIFLHFFLSIFRFMVLSSVSDPDQLADVGAESQKHNKNLRTSKSTTSSPCFVLVQYDRSEETLRREGGPRRFLKRSSCPAWKPSHLQQPI